MKKLLSIIFAISIVLTFAGCKDVKEDEKLSDTNQIISIETQRLDAEKDAEIVEKAPAVENLSKEDKAIKAEIAKYVDTDVDFRHKKQAIIQNKAYDILFAEFDSEYNPEKIFYKNDLGDEFGYDIKTGKLCNVKISSAIIEKGADSIDIKSAQNIALEFFPKDCNIDDYTNDVYKEAADGYVFWYTRYIGKYVTTDAFRIKIGFDGKVIYINDFTDVFDDKNINFEEEFIDNKIQDFIIKDDKIEMGTVVVLVNNDTVCVDCSFKKTDSNGMVSAFNTSIPLEENNTEDGSVS